MCDKCEQKEQNELNSITELGQTELPQPGKNPRGTIHCLTIIGQIEGHIALPNHNKTTKYEHVLPQLVAIADNPDIDGLLIVLNTVGGDVEAGLCIAELIASLGKPSVSIVLGGGHSIGVPLATAANYTFITQTATMTIHPIRMNGTIIGVSQTFDYFEKMQDRIIEFVATHSRVSRERFKEMMLDTTKIAKDVGTIVIGEEAVSEGVIDEVGGLDKALEKLYGLIEEKRKK